MLNLPACPIRDKTDGAPFQPGERVKVVAALHPEVDDGRPYIGRAGTVDYLEYFCGCGQSFPHDPMIGVLFDEGGGREFWHEEIVLEACAA